MTLGSSAGFPCVALAPPPQKFLLPLPKKSNAGFLNVLLFQFSTQPPTRARSSEFLQVIG